VFVGARALAYADDVALLAPTPQAVRRLLKICEEYGKMAASSCLCYIIRYFFVAFIRLLKMYALHGAEVSDVFGVYLPLPILH